MSSPKNIDVVYDLILEDRQIGLKCIAEVFKIPYERISRIVHHELGTRKLSAKWIPKCLNADHFEQELSNLLDRIVTVDPSL